MTWVPETTLSLVITTVQPLTGFVASLASKPDVCYENGAEFLSGGASYKRHQSLARWDEHGGPDDANVLARRLLVRVSVDSQAIREASATYGYDVTLQLQVRQCADVVGASLEPSDWIMLLMLVRRFDIWCDCLDDKQHGVGGNPR